MGNEMRPEGAEITTLTLELPEGSTSGRLTIPRGGGTPEVRDGVTEEAAVDFADQLRRAKGLNATLAWERYGPVVVYFVKSSP